MECCASFTSIPIIDVEPLLKMRNTPHGLEDSEALEVVKQIDEACRNVGFFYAKGHGVPPDLVDNVRDLAREFFRLPTDAKAQIAMSRANGWRGYQKVGENITNKVPDLHEAIDYVYDYNGNFPPSMLDMPLVGRNRWPDLPETFRPQVEHYLDVMKDLGKTIMQAIGLALAGSRETFEGTRAGDPFWVLRVIGYPPATQKDPVPGCGEHTDYGLLTLVNQDNDVRALQVKNQAGQWIWADPIPGTFVVNIGDMLKVWTNGLYSPTLHRVVSNDSKYRVSLPFFYEPNFEAIVEPLEICKERTGGIAKYAPIKYGDHLISKVLNNFVENIGE